MTKILGNIYDRTIAILFGTYYGNLFLTKLFSKPSYIYVFIVQKTAELVLEKLP